MSREALEKTSSSEALILNQVQDDVQGDLQDDGLRRCPECGEPVEQLVTMAGRSFRMPAQCDCERRAIQERRHERASARTIEECAEIRRRWGMETDVFRAQTFESFDLIRQPSMVDVVNRMKIEAHPIRSLHRMCGLYIRGHRTGTGKSHLVNAAANYISRENNCPAIAIELARIMPLFRPNSSWTAEERGKRMAELIAVPFLGLNDAWYRVNEAHFDAMLEILEGRDDKITWLSSNWLLDPLVKSIDSRFADLRLKAERCASRVQRRMNLIAIPDEAVDYSRFLVRDRKRERGS